MPDLMSYVEALSVVIILRWIQYDYRAVSGMQRVSINSRDSRLAENHDYTRALHEPDDVLDWPRIDSKEDPSLARCLFWRGVSLIWRYGKVGKQRFGKLDDLFKETSNLRDELAVGFRLI